MRKGPSECSLTGPLTERNQFIVVRDEKPHRIAPENLIEGHQTGLRIKLHIQFNLSGHVELMKSTQYRCIKAYQGKDVAHPQMTAGAEGYTPCYRSV